MFIAPNKFLSNTNTLRDFMNTKTFTAVIHKEENLYVAQCPEVGTVSQAENVEEAIANLKEATELYARGISST